MPCGRFFKKADANAQQNASLNWQAHLMQNEVTESTCVRREKITTTAMCCGLHVN